MEDYSSPEFWAKAPEGATHYTLSEDAGSRWLKERDDGVRCFRAGSHWQAYPADSYCCDTHFARSIARPATAGAPPTLITALQDCVSVMERDLSGWTSFSLS